MVLQYIIYYLQYTKVVFLCNRYNCTVYERYLVVVGQCGIVLNIIDSITNDY